MAILWRDLQTRVARLVSPDPATHIRLRLRLPLILIALLLILALLTPDRIWTTLLVGLSGLALIAFLWARSLAAGLSGERYLRFGWVSVGDRLQEEFRVVNGSGLPALWVEVADESSVPDYNAAVVRSVGGHDHVTWRQSAVCRRRGQYQLGPWTLRSGDPFGLFEVTRRYETTEEIIIHPPIHANLPIPLPPGQSEGRARTVTRSWQATINAAGVRDYQHQDPYHWIHWRTSAHRDELFVRQFERDAAGDIWLLVDCEASIQLGAGPDGTEEQAVLLAASLSAQAMLETRAVGLAVYGHTPRVVPPAVGQAQQWAILRALALLRADGTAGLARALRDLAGTARRGSAVVVITPSASPDWIPELVRLEQNGLESHVLLLDRASFGDRPEDGRNPSEGLRRAILASGFRCQLVQRDSLGKTLVEEEKHGYWEFKVTGTGKAIAVRRPFD